MKNFFLILVILLISLLITGEEKNSSLSNISITELTNILSNISEKHTFFTNITYITNITSITTIRTNHILKTIKNKVFIETNSVFLTNISFSTSIITNLGSQTNIKRPLPPNDIMIEIINALSKKEIKSILRFNTLSTNGNEIQAKKRLLKYLGLIEEDKTKTTAQPKKKKKKGIIVEHADDVQYVMLKDEEGYLTISGGVKVKYNKNILYADKVRINLKTQDFMGYGDIHFSDGDNYIDGNLFYFNAETEKGIVYNSVSEMERIFYNGKAIRKIGKDDYLIDAGFFSPCDAETPHFSIKATKIWIYNKENIFIFNMIYYTGDIPMFYFPLFIKGKYGTGIASRIGNSSREGFYIQNTAKKWFKYLGHIKFKFDYYQKLGEYFGLESQNSINISKLTNIINTLNYDIKAGIADHKEIGERPINGEPYFYNILTNRKVKREFPWYMLEANANTILKAKGNNLNIYGKFEIYNNNEFNYEFGHRSEPTTTLGIFGLESLANKSVSPERFTGLASLFEEEKKGFGPKKNNLQWFIKINDRFYKSNLNLSAIWNRIWHEHLQRYDWQNFTLPQLTYNFGDSTRILDFGDKFNGLQLTYNIGLNSSINKTFNQLTGEELREIFKLGTRANISTGKSFLKYRFNNSEKKLFTFTPKLNVNFNKQWTRLPTVDEANADARNSNGTLGTGASFNIQLPFISLNNSWSLGIILLQENINNLYKKIRNHSLSCNISFNIRELLRFPFLSKRKKIPVLDWLNSFNFSTGFNYDLRKVYNDEGISIKPYNASRLGNINFNINIAFSFGLSITEKYIHSPAVFRKTKDNIATTPTPLAWQSYTAYENKADNSEYLLPGTPQANNFSISYSFPVKLIKLPVVKVNSISTSFNWNHSFIEPKNDRMNFNMNISISFKKILILNFNISSQAKEAYRYYMFKNKIKANPDYSIGEYDRYTWEKYHRNFFKDIAMSFAFWNPDLRRSALFNLQNISMSLTHNLHCWTMSLSWSTHNQVDKVKENNKWVYFSYWSQSITLSLTMNYESSLGLTSQKILSTSSPQENNYYQYFQ